MVEKNIVAVLANVEGLPASVVEKIKEKNYSSDQVFEVKGINGSSVLIKSTKYNEKDTFEVSLDNVALFKQLGDDYMVYELPKTEESSKEKGE